jgi:hypothetical protein
MAVISIAVVSSRAVVSMAVVGIAVVSLARVSIGIVSTGEGLLLVLDEVELPTRALVEALLIQVEVPSHG